MPIPNFKPEEFATNLAKQAIDLVPGDLTDYQKKYIVNKLYQFCILAGNALNQDDSVTFTSAEANAIVQLIGEWTFHKNVDLIRANIQEDCWDPVLQQVAFAVFETAKQVESEKVETTLAIKTIEDIVKDTYNKSLMELARKGKIKETDIPEILSYSNVDTMAAQPQPEVTKEQENKFLKCASLALLLKTMPKDKISKILSSFDSETAKQIQYFIDVPDLEQKLDSKVANSLLSEFRQYYSNKKQPQFNLANKIHTLKDLYDEFFIVKQVKFERSIIQVFVQNCLADNSTKSEMKLSPYIENIVYDYLVTKLTA
jgi:hypothetical protein